MKSAFSTIDDYKVLELIGNGGQANVYLCVKDFKLYAVKVFNSGAHKAEPFRKETQFLSLFNHENLVRMSYSNVQATVKTNNGTESKKSIIALQFASKGDLYQYISITKGFKVQFCKAIFRKLIKGLEYLKQKGVAHRDIKPQNILFDEDFELKITDFGLSTFSEGNQKDYVLKTKVGTEGFKAPEVDLGSYNGQKADIFSIGVILFSLFVGSPPFLSTKSSDRIYKNITNKNYEKFWQIHEKNKPKGFFPQQLKKLLSQLLCSDPQNRPTIQSLKDNKWLNDKYSTDEQLQKQLKTRFGTIMQESQIKKGIDQILKKNKQLLVKEQILTSQFQICQNQNEQTIPEQKNLNPQTNQQGRRVEQKIVVAQSST